MTGPRTYAAVALVALVAACGSPPKEYFYTLGDAGSAPGTLPSLDYAVVVGPIAVPDLVDRPQFVLRVTGSEVRIEEQVRWAEPLKQGIPRLVAANLAQGLQNARVTPQAAGAIREPDFRVILEVQRFDSALAQGATLEVLWTVRRVKSGEQHIGRANIYEAAGAGYEELVAAHGRAIATLSRSIAGAINTLREKDAGADPGQPAAMTGAR